jgi:hypothetical protein
MHVEKVAEQLVVLLCSDGFTPILIGTHLNKKKTSNKYSTSRGVLQIYCGNPLLLLPPPITDGIVLCGIIGRLLPLGGICSACSRKQLFLHE